MEENMMEKLVTHIITNNMEEHDKKELQKMLDAQTELIFTEINKVKATLAPIAAIYDKTIGFNSVIRFIFRSLIVPLSIIIGILISIREIFINAHK